VGAPEGYVQTAWWRLGSSLEVTWLALGGPFLSFFGINGVRNKRSHFLGPPFPEFKACFSAMYGRLAFLERLDKASSEGLATHNFLVRDFKIT